MRIMRMPIRISKRKPMTSSRKHAIIIRTSIRELLDALRHLGNPVGIYEFLKESTKSLRSPVKV